MVSSTPWPYFTPGKDPVPILQEVGWAPGPVWKGGKSRPHRDSTPHRPARSSVAIPTELPAHIGFVYCDFFQDCNRVKSTSVIDIKTNKEKMLESEKYINLRSVLVLSLTNCCCSRKYRGIFVFFVSLLEFF